MFKTPEGNHSPSNYRGMNSATTVKHTEAARSPFRPTGERGAANRQLFEQRKAAGLCYSCGDKYYLGNQCKPQAVNTLQGSQEITEIFDEDNLQEEKEDQGNDSEEE